MFSNLCLEYDLYNYIILVRKSPGVIRKVLETRRNYYFDTVYKPPRRNGRITKEGVSAIESCIEFLHAREQSITDLGHLKFSKTMTRLMKSHDVREPEKEQYFQSDISHFVHLPRFAEFHTAQDILVNILIDDGNKSRETRKLLFQDDVQFISIHISSTDISIILHSKIFKILKPLKEQKEYDEFNYQRNFLTTPPMRQFNVPLEWDESFSFQHVNIKNVINGSKKIRTGDRIIEKESTHLDFKIFPSSLNIPRPQIIGQQWLKKLTAKLRNYFVSFSNTLGGSLVIGVHDKSRLVDGETIDDMLEEKIVKSFDETMKNTVFPQPECKDYELKFIPLKGNYRDLKIICLEVKKSDQFYVFRENGGFRSLQRQIESNMPLDWSTIRKKFVGGLFSQTEREKVLVRRKELDVIKHRLMIEKRPLVIIASEAGTGKTYLLNQMIESEDILAFFDKVIWIFCDLKSVEEIQKEFREYKPSSSSEKKNLLILDRVTTEDQITGCMKEFPNTVIVATATEKFRNFENYIVELKLNLNESIPYFEKKFNLNLKSVKEYKSMEEIKDLCTIMKNLKVDKYDEIMNVLKIQHPDVHKLIMMLQVFDRKSSVPISLTREIGYMSNKDLLKLQENLVIRIHRRNKTFKVLLHVEIKKDEKTKLHKVFVEKLMASNLSKFDQSALRYYFRNLFFHFHCGNHHETIEEYLWNFKTWVYPKFEFFRDLKFIIKDYSFIAKEDIKMLNSCFIQMQKRPLSAVNFRSQLLFRILVNTNGKITSNKLKNYVKEIEDCSSNSQGGKRVSFLPRSYSVFYNKNKKRFFTPFETSSFLLYPKLNLLIFGTSNGEIFVYKGDSFQKLNLFFTTGGIAERKSPITDLFIFEDSFKIKVLYSLSSMKIIEWNLLTGSKRREYKLEKAASKMFIGINYICTVTKFTKNLVVMSKIDGRVVKNFNDVGSIFFDSANSVLLLTRGSVIYRVDLGNTSAVNLVKFVEHDDTSVGIFYVATCAKSRWLVYLDDSFQRIFICKSKSGERVGKFFCPVEIKSIYVYKNHIYLYDELGKIQKLDFDINEDDEEKRISYLGSYNVLFSSEKIVKHLVILHKEFLYVLDHFVEYVKKRGIIKRNLDPKYRPFSTHFIVPNNHINISYFSFLRKSGEVRLLDGKGTVMKSIPCASGSPKCISRDKKFLYYLKNETNNIVKKEISTLKEEVIPNSNEFNFLNVTTGELLIGQTMSSVVVVNYGSVLKTQNQMLTRCSIDNNDCVYVCTEKKIEIYDIDNHQNEDNNAKVNEINVKRVKYVDVTVDGKYIIFIGGSSSSSGGGGGGEKLENGKSRLFVYNLFTRTIQHQRNFEHPFSVLSACISPDNKFLVTSCEDGYLRTFDFHSDKILATFRFSNEIITTLTFLKNPKTAFVVAGSLEGNVFSFELEINLGKKSSTRFSRDEQQLVRSRSENRWRVKRVSSWNKKDFSMWLRSKNPDFSFLKYDVLFEENHIDGSVVHDLREEHLKEIGIKSVGHRIMIMKYIQELKKDQK